MKYDLGKCMLWYIRYLQAALEASGRRDSGDEEYIGAREEHPHHHRRSRCSL
jgi:hypothetical protein